MNNSDKARFWSKVDTSGDCWEWTAGCFKRGYGAFSYAGKNPGYAHRFSYELHHGPIPKGGVVMHTCDNRKCVNPAHLNAGTQRDNIHDSIKKGRWMTKVRESVLRNWHPISTAPKDGTRFRAKSEAHRRITWFGKMSNARQYGWCYGKEPGINLWHPTHWKPLEDQSVDIVDKGE